VDGIVGLCCSGYQGIGNIRKQPIQEIFSSEKFIEIKNNLSQNQPHTYCQGCYNIERTAPGSSQKSSFNDQFPITDGTRKIKLADIRWSNVCNLSCRYCNINDSSEWRKIRGLPIETVNKDYIESLFEEIERNKDNIECLYLLGGEPLMQKYNERLLTILNKSVKIDVLTNGSVANLSKNRIYNLLKEFPNTYWNLSFDNVSDRFEYVRAGGNWNVLCDNIVTMRKDFGANNVTFHPVYTVWNALNLKEYYDFAEQMGNLRVNWQLGLAKIDEPEYASNGFLTFGHNSKIINRAIEEIDQLGVQDYFLDGVKQSLKNDTPEPDKGKNFLTWLEKMETLIPPKYTFKELWPELNTLLTDNE
jgi:sulfatase maturation enzyme AslB (radical SAM superfamily)